jgi:hypothetical protein
MNMRNYFEAIFNFIVYRDGDKPPLVRLPAGGGRVKSSGIQCFIDAGLVNFIFIEKEHSNYAKKFI